MSIESDPFNVSKKEKEATAGRKAAGTVFSGWHGLAAGKKGHKLRAAGNEVGGGILGNLAGTAVGGAVGGVAGAATRNPALGLAGAGLGSTVGTYTGAYQGTKAAQRKGHYKVQKAYGLPGFRQARRAQAAQDVMALKGTGRKTLKAMEQLRPKPKGKVQKNDPFGLDELAKFSVRVPKLARPPRDPVLGDAMLSGGKHAAPKVASVPKHRAPSTGQKASAGTRKVVADTKNAGFKRTVGANARVLGASTKNSFGNLSNTQKIGLGAAGTATVGGGVGYSLNRKKPSGV